MSYSFRIPRSDGRTPEQITDHYRIEKELAERLCAAGKEERRHLYTDLYDDLFRRVPHHPLLTRKQDARAFAREAARKLRLLGQYLTPETIFLEIGPGDCSVAFEVAKHIRKVYAVDVSTEISRADEQPANFELIISDGCSIDLPESSVDLAYSNQLMEHLHPDDAIEQLSNVYQALRPGGRYICITPNRVNGPHDVSKYFDSTATGFHLKEYTLQELATMFRAVGFTEIGAYIGGRGFYMRFPLIPLLLIEKVFARLPTRLRKSLGQSAAAMALLGVKLAGIK